MLLSDGGEIALTFADDRNSTAKWADLGIDSQTFKTITPDQFEVVELGDGDSAHLRLRPQSVSDDEPGVGSAPATVALIRQR